MNRRQLLKVSAFGTVTAAGLVGLGTRAAFAQDEELTLTNLLSQNVDELPKAAEGEVEVVLAKAVFDNRVAAIIHNGTEEDYEIEGVTAVAKDDSGAELATSNEAKYAPTTIPAGGYAVCSLRMAGVAPEDAELEFTFGPVDSPFDFTYTDLTPTELTVDGTTVTVKADAPADLGTGQSEAIIIFLSDEGEIIGNLFARAMGEPTEFTADTGMVWGEVTESWIVGAFHGAM